MAYTTIDLFAGIGGMRLGFAACGCENVFSSEWDSYAQKMYAANFGAMPYSCALRAGGSYNYLVVNGVRRLTGREMLRLQGFPDDFIVNIPYSQVRKVAGNSVTVPVIQAIAKQMLAALESSQLRAEETLQWAA